jgi:hypothetical protein
LSNAVGWSITVRVWLVFVAVAFWDNVIAVALTTAATVVPPGIPVPLIVCPTRSALPACTVMPVTAADPLVRDAPVSEKVRFGSKRMSLTRCKVVSANGEMTSLPTDPGLVVAVR